MEIWQHTIDVRKQSATSPQVNYNFWIQKLFEGFFIVAVISNIGAFGRDMHRVFPRE